MGTEPADYTYNFIEAMASGLPIVGYRKFNPDIDQATNEIDIFLDNQTNGFYYDNVPDIVKKINELIEDEAYRNEIGKNAREFALRNFDYDIVREKWANFLVKKCGVSLPKSLKDFQIIQNKKRG